MALTQKLDLRPNLVSKQERNRYKKKRKEKKRKKKKRKREEPRKVWKLTLIMDSMSFGMDLWISCIELYGILRFCMVNSLSSNLGFC